MPRTDAKREWTADLGYKGKTVVVTGAASGIGRAITETLVQFGAKVYAIANRSPVLVDGIEKIIPMNLSDKDSIDEAFKLIPEHIDSFFAVAGVQGDALPFMKTMKIDFVANKYMAEKYLINRMGQDGSICLVSSATAAGWEREGNKKYYKAFVEADGWDETVKAIEESGLTKLPTSLAYFCAKMALNYYSAKLQSVFGPKHVRVNVLVPGATATNFGSETKEVHQVTMDELMAYIPYSRKIAAAEEAAYPAIFINSIYASYVSGTMLYCDYGVSIEKDAGLRDYQLPTFDELLQQI